MTQPITDAEITQTPADPRDDDRWKAVADRDVTADGEFFYSVKTTGVYCRPGCPSKTPKRANVRFHDGVAEAEAAGFRPCLRCRPTATPPGEKQAVAVAHACRLIETAPKPPTLDELALAVGLDPHHFHRLFKEQTGLTPKGYADARRVKTELADAGVPSTGRLEEAVPDLRGTTIRYALGQSWLGAILVAATAKGVCSILLGDDPAVLVADLRERFPTADLAEGDADFAHTVAAVVDFVARPSQGLSLPLDAQGTAFQQRVWKTLRRVPAGATTTYSKLADKIGRPTAGRAVAAACAANPIAVAIPCHRVVRNDGTLSGYRWGVERKAELLRREKEED
ncbi:MAG: bifunctional transcriptional activator/DNA repair enzyme AdaA [Planctomycetia bacterium]